MQLKLFTGMSVPDLERSVNQWLVASQNKREITRTEIAVCPKRALSDPYVVIAIWYSSVLQ